MKTYYRVYCAVILLILFNCVILLLNEVGAVEVRDGLLEGEYHRPQ